MTLLLDDTEPAIMVLTRASSSASTADLLNSRSRGTTFKVTPALLRTVLTVALGSGFMFGYHLGVVNNPAEVMKTYFNHAFFEEHGRYLDAKGVDLFWSLAVSFLPFGAIFGGLASNYFTHKLGRKEMLLLNNAIGLMGSAFQIWTFVSHFCELFFLGRFITGIYVGVIAAMAPTYLSEIAPVQQRGYIGTSFQLSVVSGLFVSTILGLPEIFGSKHFLVYLFVISFAVCILQSILLFFCPESPRFLLLFKSDAFAAMESLRKLRNCPDVSEDLAEIDNETLQNSDDALNQNRARSLLKIGQVMRKPLLRKMFLISLFLHFSQIITGVNVMLSYSATIIQKVFGSQKHSAQWTCAIFAALIPFTVISALLIEKLGRRVLHLSGLVGTLCSSLLVMFALINPGLEDVPIKIMLISGIALFMFFYAIGPGSIPWLMVPELVPSSARSSVTSFCGSFNLFLVLCVTLAFPSTDDVIGPKLFLIFVSGSLVATVVLYCVLPETKGRTSDEVLMSAAEESFRMCRCLKRRRLLSDDICIDRDADPVF